MPAARMPMREQTSPTPCAGGQMMAAAWETGPLFFAVGSRNLRDGPAYDTRCYSVRAVGFVLPVAVCGCAVPFGIASVIWFR